MYFHNVNLKTGFASKFLLLYTLFHLTYATLCIYRFLWSGMKWELGNKYFVQPEFANCTINNIFLKIP